MRHKLGAISIIAAFLLLIPNMSRAQSSNETLDFSQNDKQNHILMTTALTLGSHAYLRSQGLGKWESLFTSAIFVGVLTAAKEATDPSIDRLDLQANGYGIGIGFTLGMTFDWL